MIEFIIQSGKHQGKRLSLSNDLVVIGRESDCQIRLTSDEVSRRHCELQKKEVGIVVRDLESRNGTFINELEIEAETLLQPGDQLRIGPMILQLPGKSEELPGSRHSSPKEKAKSTGADPTSDDDIASWLSVGDEDSDSSGSGDTTIVRAVKTPPPTPAPIVAPEPPKKTFKSIADEAADIIRRHRENLDNEES